MAESNVVPRGVADQLSYRTAVKLVAAWTGLTPAEAKAWLWKQWRAGKILGVWDRGGQLRHPAEPPPKSFAASLLTAERDESTLWAAPDLIHVLADYAGPARRRRGFREQDRPLVEEMRQAIQAGQATNAWAASARVVARAVREGDERSVRTRLCRRYAERYGPVDAAGP